MTIWLEIDGGAVRVELPEGFAAGGTLACSVDGRPVVVEACVLQPGVLSLLVDGRQRRCLLDQNAVVVDGRRVEFLEVDPRAWNGRRGTEESGNGPRAVKAPMPGRVVRVAVAVGQAVDTGDAVVVIEAMKMQNELRSPKSGRVVRLSVTEGDTVQAGDVLAMIE